MSQSSSTADTSFTRTDVSYLALLILLASLLHGWLIAHTEVLARDGAGFVRYAPAPGARAVARGDPQQPSTSPLPRNHPGDIAADSQSVRNHPRDDALMHQLAAGLAGVLLVVPMYSLGRTLFDRRVGFWSAVLFQCLPVTARMLSDALSDALCLFLVASALALGCRALRTASPWRFALCGVFGGLAYLTRPEGILPVAVVGLVWLGMQVRVVQAAQRAPLQRLCRGLDRGGAAGRWAVDRRHRPPLDQTGGGCDAATSAGLVGSAGGCHRSTAGRR